MPSETFEQFRNLVLRDITLQEKIRQFASENFIARLVGFGAEHGFEFSVEDVDEAMQAGRRSWIERWL